METKVKTTQELLDEIENLPDFNYDNDPDFVASYTNGSVVQEIMKIMDKKNISQTELANMIGKSRQYISRIMNEKRNFTINSLAMFSCALGCNLSLSITEKDEEELIDYKYNGFNLSSNLLETVISKPFLCNDDNSFNDIKFSQINLREQDEQDEQDEEKYADVG